MITDAYSKDWRAHGLPGSDQTTYTVMPANYALRAVPLSKGHHRFRLEYLPRAFTIGKWISIVSLVVYLGMVLSCTGVGRVLWRSRPSRQAEVTTRHGDGNRQRDKA